jgi:hypothetical protein
MFLFLEKVEVLSSCAITHDYTAVKKFSQNPNPSQLGSDA